MLIKLVALFIVFFVNSTSLMANAFNWDFAGWYGGGMYPNIVVDAQHKGRVFITSDVAGLWRSENSGDQWFFANSGLRNLNIPSLAIAPSNSDIIYLAMPNGMMRSDDGGLNWNYIDSTFKGFTFSRPTSYRSIAISKNNPDVLFVGTDKGKFYQSNNAGKSWKEFNLDPFLNGSGITAVQLLNDQRYVFIASRKGVLRIDLKVSKIEFVLESSKAQPVLDMVLNNMSNNQVLFVGYGKQVGFSRDLGATWSYSEEVPEGDQISRLDVAINDSSVTLLVATLKNNNSDGRIFLTKDLGLTWSSCNRNLHYDLDSNHTRAWLKGFSSPRGLKIDPFDQNIFYYSDTWGVWRTTDGGQSWQEKIKGAPNTAGSDITVDRKGNILVATMDDGLSVSKDEGASYKSLIPAGGITSGGHVWRVLNPDITDREIIASGFLWNPPINKIFRSKGLEEFSEALEGLPKSNPRQNTMWGTGYGRALAVDPTNPKRIYLGIDGDDGGGLFISDDAGRKWVRSEGQPKALRIYNGLAVDPTDANIVYWAGCGRDGGIYQSLDQGITWNLMFNKTEWIFDLKVDQTGIVYAAGVLGANPVLYASKDKGKKWELLKKFNEGNTLEAIAIDPKNAATILVSTVYWNEGAGGKVYVSNDAGKNFHDVTGNLPVNSGAAAIAIDNSSDTVYLQLYAGSVYKSSMNTLKAI